MDVLRQQLPWSFIRDRVRLTWTEALFGLEQMLVGPEVPIQVAMEALLADTETNPDVLELASLGPSESVRATLAKLAASERRGHPEEVKNVWLYLVLAWIFEHRADFADPLQQVEIVYADFGYPTQIRGFVRYMPELAPALGSPTLNEIRLFERWRAFLHEQSLRLCSSHS